MLERRGEERGERRGEMDFVKCQEKASGDVEKSTAQKRNDKKKKEIYWSHTESYWQICFDRGEGFEMRKVERRKWQDKSSGKVPANPFLFPCDETGENPGTHLADQPPPHYFPLPLMEI
ncbi:hypothetical protein LSTR_LSTR013923 [Laodelphax striatellus]|uniref:Uncharacterized protein n=1 Tax=Laodelphax striatellus TaxID=195883 RepID=A0A482XIM9_LAOST|nr:hypothetical protein LSTR_LSTR013923 [Laodelphax striatellus]